jgi:chromosome segregation ATPase
VASFPSDELAERRARRDGRNVVALDERALDGVQARLAAARHEVAVLQARLGETIAERDRMAAVAAGRREQADVARSREASLRARLRGADGEVARVRAELAARTAAEASLRVEATGLHARIHALRAQTAGHDARVRELASVVDDLTGVATDARGDVERHLAAREAAEEGLAAERARAGALAEELASVRAELGALHAARDRTLGAEERARAARAAELQALRAAGERLRAVPPAPVAAEGTTLELAVELARAAERLRTQHRPEPEGDPAPEPAPRPAVAVSPPRVAPPVSAGRPPMRAGGLRHLVHRLLARRG